MGVNAALNTARLGLAASQFAIDVTSANVSNVNTPGYVRQRPEFEATGSIDVLTKNFQVGVDIQQVQRIYDRYLESQIVSNGKDVGYSKTKKDYLQRIEGIFNEVNGGGINDLLGKFWASWQNLSANPQGLGERAVVLAAAEDLSSMFREFSGNLTATTMDVRSDISGMVSNINSDIEKIGELNIQIAGEGINRGDANLLLNERSRLLNSLAEKIGINYIEDASGQIAIYLSGGDSVVQGAGVRKLEIVGDDIRIEGTTQPITSGITSGNLGAMLELRDRVIPGYLDSLNELAAGIVNTVNDQHRKGYTAGGEVAGDFFVPIAVTTPVNSTAARNIAVSAEISGNLEKIAASATVNDDGENAGAIGALSNKVINWGTSTSTINGFYSALTAQVGLDVNNAVNKNDHRIIIKNQLVEQWESSSGVSIDEEMMNLIKYQMGYTAAGRLVTVTNELLDTLINLGK
jgi:flagellar hook-associated protein 1 FlgK